MHCRRAQVFGGASQFFKPGQQSVRTVRHDWLGWCGSRLFCDQRWCNKSVASSWNVDEIAISSPAVAKHPPQRRDMNCEISGRHERVRPNPRHECLFAHQFARTFNQRDEDVEGATTEAKWL